MTYYSDEYGFKKELEPHELLVVSILERAVKDYSGKSERLSRDAIRFFMSDWYKEITTIDPMKLMIKADGLKNFNKYYKKEIKANA